MRVALAACLLVACAGDPASSPQVDVETHGDETDAAAGDIAPEVDGTSETDTTPAPIPCPSGGFVTAFDPSLEPARPGALAADFDVATLAGHYHLAGAWDGCESHVVFVHFPGVTDALWRSDASLLFTEGHPNTHYLFVSDDPDADTRVEDLLVAERSIEAALRTVVRDEDTRLRWRERIHYVTGRARELEGGIGDYVRSELAFRQTAESQVDLGERGVAGTPLPVVFGIDRAQRFDPGDNLSPAVGRDPSLSMAAFLPRFFAAQARHNARLMAPSHRIPLIAERTTRRVIDVDLVIPESLTVEILDVRDNAIISTGASGRPTRAWFDVEVTCDERNPFACSEWDRIASISRCSDDTCATRHELARWITPYWRRGGQFYRLDVSALLPILMAGPQRLRVELGPEWERPTPWRVEVDLSLETFVGDQAARGAMPLFFGGAFDGTWRREATIEVPLDASRVEVHALVSGHGQTAGDNCAEWCDHRHRLAVDGTELPPIAHTGAAIGEPRGCAARADDGVIPGQWGNWAQQRAYWCPGLAVPWQVRDATALVTPGSEHLLTLGGTLGSAGAPSGGDIALAAWLVWY